MNKELNIIKYWDIALFLAQQDLKSRFRGSQFGILWLAINQLSFSLGAGFIWSKVFGTNAHEFIPFLSIGFAIWSFISSAMIEGCSTFITAHHYIKQLPLPKIIFIMRTFLVSGCYFIISFITCLVVLLCFNKLHLKGMIFSIPGFVILLGYLYGAIGSMAYLGIRYRDIQHGLPGVFSLLIMLTPVMYTPAMLINRGVGFIVYMNPFASFIEIIRTPLLENSLAQGVHYFTAIACVLFLIMLKFMLEKNWGRKIAFWS